MYESNFSQKNTLDEALKIFADDLGARDRHILSTACHLKEELVSPAWFDMLCEKSSNTVFKNLGESKNELLIQALRKAIAELPPKQRKIIRFIFWEGLSEQEIAFAIKLPRTTVSYQKSLAFRYIFEKVRPKIPSYEGTIFKP